MSYNEYINYKEFPMLISLHKSGSTWINAYIHKRYRKLGMTTPPKNLYTEFFTHPRYRNDNRNIEHVRKFLNKNYKERIALLEQLRSFGLELNHKVHVPEITNIWPWFKEFYKHHDIVVVKRRKIFSHWLSILFNSCVLDATNGEKEIGNAKDGYTGLTPSKAKGPYDEDILKSTIQEYNVQFKFNEKRFRQFVLDIRFLNDIVLKELDKPQVIWLEDIDDAWLEKRFHVKLKTPPHHPFKTLDYKVYFKPEDMAIIKEKFKERFDAEFQFYGYEYK